MTKPEVEHVSSIMGTGVRGFGSFRNDAPGLCTSNPIVVLCRSRASTSFGSSLALTMRGVRPWPKCVNVTPPVSVGLAQSCAPFAKTPGDLSQPNILRR